MKTFDIKSAAVALVLLGALSFFFPQLILFAGMMVALVGIFGGMIGVIGAMAAFTFALALPFMLFVLVPLAIFLILYHCVLKWRCNRQGNCNFHNNGSNQHSQKTNNNDKLN